MGANRRLTVVLSGGLGDCLLASPFLRHFAQSGQYDRITCALPSNAAQLYDCSPHVARLVPCSSSDLWLWGLPEDCADVFIPYANVSLDRSAPGGFRVEHTLRLNEGSRPAVREIAAIHGLRVGDASPEVFTMPADEKWADDIARQAGGAKRVLINHHSPLSEKRYPLARWQQVVDALRPHASILELDVGESLLFGTKVVHPMPSLRQSAALVRRCNCVVTIDSFAVHLAAAVGTPAIALFGPTNPAVWGHATTTCIRTSSCAVCANTARMRKCERRSCMEEIPPHLVVEAVARILGAAA